MHNEVIELATPRLRLVFDPAAAGISAIHGRFDPAGDFGPNLLSERGIAWHLLGSTNEAELSHALTAVSATDSHIDCRLDHSLGGNVLGSSDWRLTVAGDAVEVTARLTLHAAVAATAVVFDLSTTQWLLVGMFERGVVQQVCSGTSGFASTDELSAFYTVDNDLGSLAVVPAAGAQQSILIRDEASGTTGLRLVYAGRTSTEDAWAEIDWTSRSEIAAGTVFESSFRLNANDLPFPTHALDPDAFADLDDARTHFTAAYATSATTLGGYLVRGSAYPTIAMPERTYWSLHTFFDPDAWSTVGCLASSGDPYLEREARRILERALGGITAAGQIPHHFDGEEPTYVAISGVAQTGPNLFFCLAALDYVTATGDVAWLRDAWDRGMRAAIDWVVEFYDPARKLLRVIGPLWVDVFKRAGYAFDTNAAAVFVLERMADAASYLGSDLSEKYLGLAAEIREGLEALWSGDHYVTSRGDDWESIHDMVDSDGYLAPGLGLTSHERGLAVIERLDSVANMHPGGRGTWVSEVFYGPDFCYGENIGDSATAMGRMWWADLLARQSVGDRATFAKMYEAVRADQRRYTWMRERYGAEGTMIRATGYHEYPEILDKMLREGYYGLTMTMSRVTVNPMLVGTFSYNTGRVALSHAPERVNILVPGDGTRSYEVGGLTAGATYAVQGSTVTADNRGTVAFVAPAGVALEIVRE